MSRFFILSLILCGWCQANAPQGSVQVDGSALAAWLEAAKQNPGHPASWEAASASTRGGKMAEASRASFGDLPKEVPESPSVERVLALSKAIQHWDVEALIRDVSGLFPPMPDRIAKVYVVANGVPVWGDLYQRTFTWKNGEPVLDEHGEPVILVNALLVAAIYKGDPSTQAKVAYEVLRHELFHVFYAWYQASDPRWQQIKSPLTPEEELLVLIQNEGIAHFLADKDDLNKNGFPKGRGEKALADLETAVAAIEDNRATKDLLRKANMGSFWDKYASISGMLFAYGVEKVYGIDGLKASIQQGPWSLLLKYSEAAKQWPEWPKPSTALLNWARGFEGKLPPVDPIPRSTRTPPAWPSAFPPPPASSAPPIASARGAR